MPKKIKLISIRNIMKFCNDLVFKTVKYKSQVGPLSVWFETDKNHPWCQYG